MVSIAPDRTLLIASVRACPLRSFNDTFVVCNTTLSIALPTASALVPREVAAPFSASSRPENTRPNWLDNCSLSLEVSTLLLLLFDKPSQLEVVVLTLAYWSKPCPDLRSPTLPPNCSPESVMSCVVLPQNLLTTAPRIAPASIPRGPPIAPNDVKAESPAPAAYPTPAPKPVPIACAGTLRPNMPV